MPDLEITLLYDHHKERLWDLMRSLQHIGISLERFTLSSNKTDTIVRKMKSIMRSVKK